MQKLIIQIPCYNEENTLPLVLRDIPKQIDGIDIIETQIIDDGSTDKTVEIAKRLNVTHIVTYIGNKGLGNAFKTGIRNALENGATIVVNTDGDNQYKSTDIIKLVQPILDRKADLVIGNRQTNKIKHFSFFKKVFQRIGSRTVQFITGIKVDDAVSGFRAYSREAILQINVTSDFSYVLDTLIQAAKKKIKIQFVDILTNPPTRKSRLFKSTLQHIRKSSINILNIYVTYEPFNTFLIIGLFFWLLGIYPLARFLYLYINNQGQGNIQSLIIGSMLIIIGIQMLGLGIIGSLMAKQRKYTENILYNLKKNL